MKERMEHEAALAMNHGGEAINAAGRWLLVALIWLLRGMANLLEMQLETPRKELTWRKSTSR